MEYKIGMRVMHKYTKDDLWIIRIGKEQILCRTQDLREIWFYKYELAEAPSYRIESKSTRFI